MQALIVLAILLWLFSDKGWKVDLRFVPPLFPISGYTCIMFEFPRGPDNIYVYFYETNIIGVLFE